MSLSSALIEAVRLSVSDPSLDVRIADRTSRWVSDVANVSIRVLGIRRLGIDEPRIRDVGDPSGNLREMIHGVRVVRLQIVVDGDTHDLGFASEDLADRIVAGFERSDVRALLEAENLSAATCGPVLTAPARGDAGDTRSVAIFDLAFNTSREVRGDLVSWIETAPVNSALLARLRPFAGSLSLSGLSPALLAAMAPGLGNLALSGGAPALSSTAVDPLGIFGASDLRLWLDYGLGVTLGTPPDVAAWADQSGQANDAAQGTAADRPDLVAGTGIDFDGTSDYLTIPDDASLDFTTALTIGLRLRYTNVGGGVLLCKTPSGGGAWVLQTVTSSIWWRFGALSNYSITPALSAGQWYSLVFVFNGAGAGNAQRSRVWFNGVEQAQTFNGTIPGTIPVTADDLYFGRFNDLAVQHFDGDLKAAVCAAKVSTPAEVAALTAYLTGA